MFCSFAFMYFAASAVKVLELTTTVSVYIDAPAILTVRRFLALNKIVLHFWIHKQHPDAGQSIRTCFSPRNMWATWPAKLPRN
jgi:hypothetical protein